MLRSRSLSSLELLESLLARAAVSEPRIHAWVLIDEDQARQVARVCDDEMTRGSTRGPLHGIPIGVKDIYDVAGLPTRCGSEVRRNAERAGQDAVVVGRLRDSGAIL